MNTRYLLATSITAAFALLMALPSPAEETPSKEKINKFIEQLGSDNFAVREQATKELAAIGAPALEALRKAAKSNDAEVRKRAEALLSKNETLAESIRAKRVHLVYKDTPLGEAMADFQKKSGYTIHLHDPDGKLKQRKITLDTGETTFWHAAELFGDRGGLIEGNIKDLMPNATDLGVAVIGRGKAQPAATQYLILKDGKRKNWPTDDRGAIRIRAVGKSDMLGKVPVGDVVLALEVSREPKLKWQLFLTIQIDKAVDDRGQQLTQVIPKAKEGITSGFGAVLIPAGTSVNIPFHLPGPSAIRHIGECGGLSQRVPLKLRKGEKPAKSIAELRGVIKALLLCEVSPRKDKGQPAKLGHPSTREHTIVNIPFMLKNVPLP